MANFVNSKSKLRKRDEVALGPQYDGSRISREALLDNEFGDASDSDNDESESEEEGGAEFANLDDSDVEMDGDDAEIDSDNALGESDAEKFKNFAFRGSSKPSDSKAKNKRPTAADFMSASDEEDGVDDDEDNDDEGVETDEEVLDINQQHSSDDDSAATGSDEDSEDQSDDEDDEDEDESADGDSETSSHDGNDEKSRRAELRKIMNEEEKSVIATISQAAKSDADKGSAVKLQRKTFDALLGTRMVIQKGLVAINTMSGMEDKIEDELSEEAYQGAEVAAIKLWNILDGMRQNLIKETSGAETGKKRKRGVDYTTPSSKMWERMQALEVASIDFRQMTLEKWWGKAKGSTAPLTGKLNNNVTPMSLTSVIQDQLAKSEPLERTKRPRSCAPVQEKLKVLTDSNIYDDTTLYKTLLNQLVDQRKTDSGLLIGGANAPAQWAVKEAKMRKTVDTKASKGRKLRFTVHEKLQNFMAPEERGTWEPQAIDRFFGTLLGQKMTLREEDGDGEGDANEVSPEEQGFRLF